MRQCEDCPETFMPTDWPGAKYPNKCANCRHKLYKKNYHRKDYEKYLQTARFTHMRRTYGVTETDYRRMYADQNGQCAICSDPFPPIEQRQKHTHIDHNHETGKVIALLCSNCNTALGQIKHDAEISRKMTAYIEKNY